MFWFMCGWLVLCGCGWFWGLEFVLVLVGWVGFLVCCCVIRLVGWGVGVGWLVVG